MIAQRWLKAAAWWSAAGILNGLAGWAVAALFGPLKDTGRRAVLAAVVVTAGVWLAAAAGVIVLFPAIEAATGSAASPEAAGVPWLRLALTAIVAVLPAAAGLLTCWLAPAGARPRGRGLLRAAVLGYPLTVGLALTLPLLAVFLPLRWLRDRWRGWSAQALPVQAAEAAPLVQTVHDRLHDAGWHTSVTPPPALVRLPYAAVGLFGRGSLGGLLADGLPSLRGNDLEVVFYPAALDVRGTGQQRTQARAVILDTLALGDARLTWTAAGRHLEAQLAALVQTPAAAGSERQLAELARLRAEARRAALPVEEWETVERLCVQAERRLLLAALHAAPVAPPAVAAAPVTPAAAAVVMPPAPVTIAPASPAPSVPVREVADAPVASAAPAGISPAALAATLAAAAVVFWRMTAEPAQPETAGEF